MGLKEQDGTAMITLKRLNGQPFAINPDLIERLEATPDTIVVLVDGTRYIVDASMSEVIAQVRQYRAAVVALSLHLAAGQIAQRDPEHGITSGHHDLEHVVVPLPLRPVGD